MTIILGILESSHLLESQVTQVPLQLAPLILRTADYTHLTPITPRIYTGGQIREIFHLKKKKKHMCNFLNCI